MSLSPSGSASLTRSFSPTRSETPSLTATDVCIWHWPHALIQNLPPTRPVDPPPFAGPRITAIGGCAGDAYPSAGGCPPTGLRPITIVGQELLRMNVSFVFADGSLVPCLDHQHLSDTEMVCTSYAGNGTHGYAQLTSPLTLEFVFYSSTTVTLSFHPYAELCEFVGCNGHGRCDAAEGCQCVASATEGYWSGQYCSECHSRFYGQECLRSCSRDGPEDCSCSSNGVCQNGINGTGCFCVQDPHLGFWSGPTCRQCSPGYYGPSCTALCPGLLHPTPAICSGHGWCNDELYGNGVCTCDTGFDVVNSSCGPACLPGYYGPGCKLCGRRSTDDLTCTGRGVCAEGAVGDGTCRCEQGFGGPLCNLHCPVVNIDNTPATCGFGKCVANFSCICERNFAPEPNGACLNCQPLFYGLDCEQHCPKCQHGRCASGPRGAGTCVCDLGYWGTLCTAQCPGGSVRPCSGNGVCVQRTGLCDCHRSDTLGHFAGPLCTRCHPTHLSASCKVPCPATDGAVCAGRGRCFEGRCDRCALSEADIQRDMYAVCGPGCTIVNAQCNLTCPYGRWGPACQGACPRASQGGVVCGGKGSCNTTTGLCDCADHRFGAVCEHLCPGPLDSPCNGNGVCTVLGLCTCDFGFAGPACEAECPGGRVTPCSGHGICDAPSASCTCQQSLALGYYSGAQCDRCSPGFGGGDCKLVCGGLGTLLDAPLPGLLLECACKRGWWGRGCQLECPSSCSGHGVCLDGLNGTGACDCASGFYGPDCAVACSPSACTAQFGYVGAMCDSAGQCQCLTTADSHFEGALCDACTPGFYGVLCDMTCSCTNAYGCDRFSASCSCYRDPAQGYWVGAQCTDCDAAFMGSSCNIPALKMAQFSKDVMFLPADVVVDRTVPSFSVVSPDNMYLFVGNRPVSVLSLSEPPVQVAVLDFGATLVNLRADATALHAFTMVPDQASVVERVVPYSNFSMAASSSSTVAAKIRRRSRRVAGTNASSHRRGFDAQEDLSTAREVFSGTSRLLAILQQNGMLVASTTPEVAIDLRDVFRLEAPRTVAALADDGLWVTIAVTGGSLSLQSWHLVVFNMSLTGQTRVLANVTDPRSGLCSPATPCSALHVCIMANSSAIVCIAGGAAGAVPVRIDLATASSSSSSSSSDGLATVTLATTRLTRTAFTVTALSLDTYTHSVMAALLVGAPPTTTSAVFFVAVASLSPYAMQEPDDPTLSATLVVSNIAVNGSARFFTCIVFIDRPLSVRLYAFNLFGLSATTPSVVDADGSYEVAFHGFGFPTDRHAFWRPRCVFMALPTVHVGPAVVISSRLATCVVPTAFNTSCAAVPVTLRLAARTTLAAVPLTIRRPRSATLVSIVSAVGANRAAVGRAQAVTITGRGFVDSPFAACRLRVANGTAVSHTMLTGLQTGLSHSYVTAVLPGMPTEAKGVVEYSHDGVVYGDAVVALDVVGPPAGLVMSTAGLQLAAAEKMPIPPLAVAVVDSVGSPLLGTLANLAFAIVLQLTFPLKARLYELGATARSNTSLYVMGGAVLFTGLVVDCPPIGNLSFVTSARPGPDIYDSPLTAALTFRVVPGAPVRLVVRNVDDNIRLNWRVAVQGPARPLQPFPSAYAVDSCGNHVVDAPDLSDTLFVAVRIANFVNGVLVETRTVTPTRKDFQGNFEFNAPFKAVFGSTVRLNFYLAGQSMVSDYVTPFLQLEGCLQQERAILRTEQCGSCPPGGLCNGSAFVVSKPGFWRSAVSAMVFTACVLPATGGVCLSDTCGVGYTGPLCSSCAPGYGRSLYTCVKCDGTYVQRTTLVWMGGTLCAVVLLLTLVSTWPIESSADNTVSVVAMPAFSALRQLLVSLLVASFIFSAAVEDVDALPPFVSAIITFLPMLSLLDLRIPAVSCLLAPTVHERLILAVVLPLVVWGIIMVLCLLCLTVAHGDMHKVLKFLSGTSKKPQRKVAKVRRERAKSIGMAIPDGSARLENPLTPETDRDAQQEHSDCWSSPSSSELEPDSSDSELEALLRRAESLTNREDLFDEGGQVDSDDSAASSDEPNHPHRQPRQYTLDDQARLEVDADGNMTFLFADSEIPPDDDDEELASPFHDVLIDESAVFASPDPRNPNDLGQADEARALSLIPPEQRSTVGLVWHARPQLFHGEALDPFGSAFDDVAMEHVPLLQVHYETEFDALIPEVDVREADLALLLPDALQPQQQPAASAEPVIRRLRPSRQPHYFDEPNPQPLPPLFEEGRPCTPEHRARAKDDPSDLDDEKFVESAQAPVEPADIPEDALRVLFEDDDDDGDAVDEAGSALPGAEPGAAPASPVLAPDTDDSHRRRRSTVTFSLAAAVPESPRRSRSGSSTTAALQAVTTARNQMLWSPKQPTKPRRSTSQPSNPFMVPRDGEQEDIDVSSSDGEPAVNPLVTPQRQPRASPLRLQDLAEPSSVSATPKRRNFPLSVNASPTKRKDHKPTKWSRRLAASTRQLNADLYSAPRLHHFRHRVGVAALAAAASALLVLYPMVLQACAAAVMCTDVDFGRHTTPVLRLDKAVSCATRSYYVHAGVAVLCLFVYGVAGPLLLVLAAKRFVGRSLCHTDGVISDERKQEAVTAILAAIFSDMDCSIGTAGPFLFLPLLATFGRMLILAASSQYLASDVPGLRRYALYLASILLLMLLGLARRVYMSRRLLTLDVVAGIAMGVLYSMLILLLIDRRLLVIKESSPPGLSVGVIHAVIAMCLVVATVPFLLLAVHELFCQHIERLVAVIRRKCATPDQLLLERQIELTRTAVEEFRRRTRKEHRRLHNLAQMLRLARHDCKRAMATIVRIEEDLLIDVTTPTKARQDDAMLMLSPTKAPSVRADSAASAVSFSQRLAAPAVHARAGDVLRAIRIVDAAVRSYDASFLLALQFIGNRLPGVLWSDEASADYLEQLFHAEQDVLETTRILNHILSQVSSVSAT